MNAHVSPSGFPALVLNADFRPLSYYPLSLWSWQDAIKAVFLERVNIVANYDRAVRSPSFEMKLPSVVSLKTFVKPSTHPAFTRFNVFLRDRFSCQYCGARDDLTFDHLLPRSRGGHTTWDNVVEAQANLQDAVRLSLDYTAPDGKAYQLKPKLADYKLPRHVVTLPALPRNATGKILKTTLREMSAKQT